MDPWTDPGYLALVAGDALDLAGEPLTPPAALRTGRGLVQVFEYLGPRPQALTGLGARSVDEILGLITASVSAARWEAVFGRPRYARELCILALRGGEYLDRRRLDRDRLGRPWAAVLRERASLQRRQGRLERARECLTEALQVVQRFDRRDDPQEMGEHAAYEAAMLDAAGDPAAAVATLDEAIRALGRDHPRLRHRLQVQAGVLAGWCDPAQAVPRLADAVADLSEDGGAPGLLPVARLARLWWASSLPDEAVETADLDAPASLRGHLLSGDGVWHPALLAWVDGRVLARRGALAEADSLLNLAWNRFHFSRWHLHELMVLAEHLVVFARRGRGVRRALSWARKILAGCGQPEALAEAWSELLEHRQDPAELASRVQHLVGRLRAEWQGPVPEGFLDDDDTEETTHAP